MSSPYAHYAKCWECGAPAGTTCMGDDDKPAIEVCDGRRLAINDSAARTKAPRAPGTSERTRYRRRHGEGVPVMAPCEHCEAPVRLWGTGLVTGIGWCSTKVCKAARKAAQAKASHERRRATQPPCERCGRPATGYQQRRYCGPTCAAAATRQSLQVATPAACAHCAGAMPIPRRRDRRFCGEGCKRQANLEIDRARKRAKRAEARQEIPPHAPCTVCGVPSPVIDRRPRVYCSPTCRETQRSRRKRSRKAPDLAS